MTLTWKPDRRLRILNFDCEARPLSWISADFVSKEITAIAAKFIHDNKRPTVWLLGLDEPVKMLEGFRKMYDQADMVTGHNIRRYDLPCLNAAMVEYGLPALSDKLTHDTYHDLIKKSGLSFSQASLGAMLGLTADKVGMNQVAWRAANRLKLDTVKLTRERVVGDVIQNIELRARLIELGYLGPPRVWRSGASARVAA